MKHRVGFNRLGRKPAHRKALHRNMVTSLFKHERIRTTKAKAREIRRTAEKMITRAKVDSVHNRRMVARDIKDNAILAKLFTDIGPRFRTRPGGYTRMLKIGQRAGDASDMVLLELVADETDDPKRAKQKSRRKPAETATDRTESKAPSPARERKAPRDDISEE
jgi:large subunit ribosomal protein L17